MLPLLTSSSGKQWRGYALAVKAAFEVTGPGLTFGHVLSHNSIASPVPVTSAGSTWTYSYNKRRLLERESLAYANKTYNIDRRYDEHE